MLKLMSGDMLKVDVEALVNPVNCVGVMGKGLALQFRTAFPENFKAYKIACDAGLVEIGRMFTYCPSDPCSPRFIINFPTKYHWKNNSKIQYIKLGLNDLVKVVLKEQIRSIAIPQLGCGLGGLDWKEVCPIIIEACESMPNVDVLLFGAIPKSTAKPLSWTSTTPP